MKKAIKIIAGAVLLCSGCAAVCALVQGCRRRDEDSTDEYEDYAEWYNANPEYADLCSSLDREGEAIPKS